ncbi:MAG: peroxiredoxin [candidate division NC10 bacterium]|jgi:peroxiredoxin|nr:peroxiredoxin [candidate division NC10 bacterium]
MAVKVGEKAPDFTLVDTALKPRSLKEFLGKTTVLVFYPAAFTGVCTKEMCAFRDNLSQLSSIGAQMVGISADTPFSNKAFAEQNSLTFPILSDYNREAIKAFGIAFPDLAGLKGLTVAKRSVFVLDKQGVVKYAWVSEDPKKEPDYAEVTKAARSLK